MQTKLTRMIPSLRLIIKLQHPGAPRNLMTANSSVPCSRLTHGPTRKFQKKLTSDIWAERCGGHRGFHWRRGDLGFPATQFDNHVDDMLKKWMNMADEMLGRKFNEFAIPVNSGRFGGPNDLSTPDKFKITFSLGNANPEDITVELKGNTLSVQAKVEEGHETNHSCHQLSFSYSVPEEVNLKDMESEISKEGLLTIEAPMLESETKSKTQTINIKRES